jgi:hypothetical protein
MSETAWPDGYWRDARWLAMCLGLVLLATFSPFLFGPYTLLTSAADAPSLYASGGAPLPLPSRPLKELDPGAGNWQSEAWLQFQHDAVFIDHRIPWWNPYDGYGQPFAAAEQSQPFFPLTLLASIHPSPRTYSWYVVARLFVAGFFAALFVRFWSRRYGALAAAVATSFAGYYLLYYSMPHMSVETLFPAVLWGTELVVRRPGSASIAALGAVVGLAHLGGMPESAMVAVVAATLYLVVRIWTSPPASRPFARLGSFAAANLLGAAIGAALLLPFLEYLPNAFDTHREGGPPIGLAHDPYTLSRAIFQRLVPLGYGPPWNDVTSPTGNGYNGDRGWFGVLAALFGLIALLDQLRPRVERRPVFGPIVALSVVATCALAKSLGAPWINWIGALPALRLIGYSKYNDVVIDVCAALLCGLGIAAFENGRRPARWVPVAATAIVAAAVSFGFANTLAAVPLPNSAKYLYGGVALAAALLTAAIVVLSIPRAAGRAPILLAALVGLEAIGSYYVPMYATIAAVPPAVRNPYAGAPYVTAIRAANPDRLRVISEGGPLWPNWAGAMRLDTPEALNAINPRRYFPFLDAFLTRRIPLAVNDLHDRFDASSDPAFTTPAAHRWMTLSSVGFLVVPAGHAVNDAHLRQIYDADARIYAYDDPLPRASIFHRAQFAATEDGSLQALADARTDVHSTLVLTETPFALPHDAAARIPGESARIAARDVDSVTIDAVLKQPGFTMLNDTEMPGWTATVDGSPVPILHADYLFRAVRVPPGRHQIRFEYRSRADAIGMGVTLFGIALTIGLGVFAVRRRSRVVEDLAA